MTRPAACGGGWDGVDWQQRADVVIVGSGFGGSVSALRLAEKGYSVLVLEQGRRIGPAEIASAKKNLRELFWMPPLGLHGFFTQHFFRHAGIVGGERRTRLIAAGVGAAVVAVIMTGLSLTDWFASPRSSEPSCR